MGACKESLEGAFQRSTQFTGFWLRTIKLLK